MNRVILMGNTTRDVELRYSPKGTAFGQFGLAVNRKWTDDSGATKEEVCFVDCEPFGKTAETLAQYVKRGDKVLVEGRLKLDQWDDKETGQKRQKLKVVVERFEFCGGNRNQENRSPQAQQAPAARGQAAAEAPQPDPTDDDVPF